MKNISLDPHDWDELEAAFRKAIAIGFDHYQSLEAQPVWKKAEKELKESFKTPLPRSSQSIDNLLEHFKNKLLPYGNGNTHPRFFGWVHGGGNLYGALGELCAALLNNNLGGRDHIGHQVEHQVLQWSRELFGFPVTSSGLLTSGTSMATLIALAVARQKAVGPAMKTQGLQGSASPLVGYCSAQSHNSILKAFQLLGLGSDALRSIAVNDDFTLDTRALAEQVAADQTAGATPFCVIATLGTVNTGAIDDLASLQVFCEREGLWLHVDAAFGGAVALLDEYRDALRGLECAESIAFDFHKWFQAPYAVGGLLVRDAALHQDTFSERKEYLTSQALGLGAGAPWFCDFGPELSRGFLALKVWFTFQGLGSERIAAVVRKHCQLASYAAKLIDAELDLERLAPVPMNIVCLRYVPPHLIQKKELQHAYIDTLNQAIVTQLQVQGLSAPSTTTLNGQLAIRVAIVNHRTETHHMSDLLKDIQQLGRLIDKKFSDLLNPTSWHLMQGGDARLITDPATNLNRYGCSPSPREEAYTFASSTATSISIPAYTATVQFHHHLLHDCITANGSSPLKEHCRQLENRIAEIFNLASLNPDILLSPSGTDAQMHTVAAIVTAQPGDWVSVVCGADETGSGTPFSVTGKHFDSVTCLGHSATKGERLAGMPNIGYEAINFRNQTGELKTLSTLDNEVEEIVSALIDKGKCVILHAMEQSKLGCWAPSSNKLKHLRAAFGERLQVVIDACQVRIDSEDLVEHCKNGDILLLTGSKFFTGPPFSGAAVFPKKLTDRLLYSGYSLPNGLRDYLPQANLGRWSPLLPDAPHSLSIGPYLRWHAALTEMERYFQVPKQERVAGMNYFGEELIKMLEAYPHIEIVFDQASPWWTRTNMKGNELSARRSIFPFLIRYPDGEYLSQAQVKALYEQLNRDVSKEGDFLGNEINISRQSCHIGQPVRIGGKNTSALRVSMGSRIISDGWVNGAYHRTHLNEELRQVRVVLDKITLCVREL